MQKLALAEKFHSSGIDIFVPWVFICLMLSAPENVTDRKAPTTLIDQLSLYVETYLKLK
jgi:hypothetical protein